MYVILFTLAFLLFSEMSHASPCSDFPWHHPAEIVEPQTFQDARHAMKNEQLSEARHLLGMFLDEYPEGALASSARWALTSLPEETTLEGDKETTNMIDRLAVQRRAHPHSPYAPWSLCRVGELYQKMGWTTEANGAFEEFLGTYPEHPLTGGVLLNAGQSFLDAKKYIEAALIFRRLVEGHKWSDYHVSGALGLADATASSQAWKQAAYWYQVVEVEDPQFIRASASSSYHYGLAESKRGHHAHAIEWYLTTYNVHPQNVVAGFALNQIGNYLFKKQHVMAALWFFHEAARIYKSEEPGRRAELALVRWIVSYLDTDHTSSERKAMYDDFDAREIYLSVSWDGVIEATRLLAQSPEGDIADEAQYWLARGYQETGDSRGALAAYRQIVESAQDESWREKSQGVLTKMLLEEFQGHYSSQSWVDLIRMYDRQKSLLSLLPNNIEWMRMIADAYRFVNLPRQALTRYEELLRHHLDPAIQEELLFLNVELANDIAEEEMIRHAAEAYIQAYPSGKQRDDIAMILGRLDFRENQVESAVTHFSFVLKQGHDDSLKQLARRERAWAYQKLGQFDAAIADYRQLVKNDSASVGIHLSLADLLYEQKQFSEAEHVYQPIAESEIIEEAKTWAQFRLALCYQKNGKKQDAENLLGGLRQPGRDVKDLEVTIQSAAAAVIDEFIPTKSASS